MLTRLRKLFAAGADAAPNVRAPAPPRIAAPNDVAAGAGAPFPIAAHLRREQGFPILDWAAAGAWLDTLEGAHTRAEAWTAIERAWLLHLRDALGAGFQLEESSNCLLLSALEGNVAKATLGYMERTRERVLRTLTGIAAATPGSKDILIVFDNEDSYYRYVSHAYPEAGEFAGSGGMYIHHGCGHFVTVKRDLSAVEPVIAHEMTHACLAHLPIPAWLNEGLAVNTEQRLAGPQPSQYTPREMHAMHLAFWGRAEIQEFWSGASFLRTDDGNLLSYDLARILVAHAAGDWEVFRAFVLAANMADGGAQAAAAHLGADLGELVCALLGQVQPSGWEPLPATWKGAPESGAFSCRLHGAGT